MSAILGMAAVIAQDKAMSLGNFRFGVRVGFCRIGT